MSVGQYPIRALNLSPYKFFFNLFEKFVGRDKLVYVANAPDIISIGVSGGAGGLGTYRLHRQIVATRLKYGFKPVIAAVSGENATLDGVALDYGLSTSAPTSDNHLHYNWNLNLQFGRALLDPNGADAQELRAARAKPKTKFCNYVFSNDSMPTTRMRREFCRALSRYKRVDCAGKSMNNTDALFKLDAQISSRWRAKLAFLSDYKFTIAFENESADNYLTEKPLQALAVGSAPIYWGCPQVAEYINPRSFINARDFDSFDALVEHVKRVDNDPDLYAEYRDAPPILPSSRFYEMQREAPPFLERIAAEALRRRRTHLELTDGLLKWRRYYQVGKLIYANRNLEWRYKSRLILRLPGVKKALLVKRMALRRSR